MSKQKPVLKLASLDKMNLHILAISSILQHLQGTNTRYCSCYGGRSDVGNTLPLHWDLVCHVLDLSWVHGFHHCCADHGWSQGIHSDTSLCVLLAHRLDQANHCRLAAAVRTHTCIALGVGQGKTRRLDKESMSRIKFHSCLFASNGCYEKNATIVLLGHLSQWVFGHQEATSDIHWCNNNKHQLGRSS